MLFEFKIKGYQEKLNSFDYFNKCIDTITYPIPPTINNFKKLDYSFWSPLLKELQKSSIDISNGELLEQLIQDNEKANSEDFIEWDSDENISHLIRTPIQH